MQNLIKLVAWMAPAFLLALIIILARMDRHDAQMAAETARFDREWALQQADFTQKKENKIFWQEQEKAASKRLEEAQIKQAKVEGKVSQQFDILEKTLQEMDEQK